MSVESGSSRILCRPTSSSARAKTPGGLLAFCLWALALIPLSGMDSAEARDGSGRIELRPEQSDPSLPPNCPTFTTLDTPIEVRRISKGNREGQRALFAEIVAQTRPECGTPVVGGIKVAPQAETGEFRFKVPLRGSRTRATFLLVDLRGIPRKFTLDVVFPDYASLMKPSVKRTTFVFGLGFTMLKYSEIDLPQINSINLTPKASIDYQLQPGIWSLGGNLFGNLSLNSTPRDLSIAFFGANVRVTRHFPKLLPPRWKLGLSAGVYSISSITNLNCDPYPSTTCSFPQDIVTFGFANLMGPQLYPSLAYALPNDHTIASYFKYSPVSSGFSLVGGSREIAFGVSYGIPKRTPDGPRPGFSFAFDFSDLVLSIDEMIGKSQSMTFSINYAF
jgi:hypothetical protein